MAENAVRRFLHSRLRFEEERSAPVVFVVSRVDLDMTRIMKRIELVGLTPRHAREAWPNPSCPDLSKKAKQGKDSQEADLIVRKR